MIFKIINKFANFYLNAYNRRMFKDVNCNLRKIKLGADVKKNFIIKFPENLTIGDGTSISGNCYINAFGGVEIGEYCHIAQGLNVYSHNHNFKSTVSLPYDSKNISKKVTIGDAVWIGANVSIAPGAKIGNGVIISMGSVVFGIIPDGATIRGNPAQVVGQRDEETFLKLYNAKAFF